MLILIIVVIALVTIVIIHKQLSTQARVAVYGCWHEWPLSSGGKTAVVPVPGYWCQAPTDGDISRGFACNAGETRQARLSGQPAAQLNIPKRKSPRRCRSSSPAPPSKGAGINVGSETDHSNQKPGWDVRIGNHTTPNPKPVNHESETKQPRIGNHGIHVGTSFNVTDAEPTI